MRKTIYFVCSVALAIGTWTLSANPQETSTTEKKKTTKRKRSAKTKATSTDSDSNAKSADPTAATSSSPSTATSSSPSTATASSTQTADAKSGGDSTKGKEVFEQCGVCHNADSAEKKMGPGLKALFSKDKMANGKKPTETNVRAKIDEGGNGMPAYKDMLSDEEKNNLIAYLHTL